jgi:spermidine synthase
MFAAMGAPRSAVRSVAPLLFGSGFCALIYQVAWQRQLRLVFGASTAASAAVVAIFIAGLGAGGWWLGKRADRHDRPLALYALLETIVAVSAAATPLLIGLAARLYVVLGGQATLGATGATVVRLVLSALVLAVPTFAMGGTLPAAARAIASADDTARTRTGLLYAVNTIGAVVGCLAATFLLLEVFGTRRTLWVAALLNVLVALTARSLSRALPAVGAASEDEASAGPAAATSRTFALVAAGVVGFAFFLMELVWYRMLGPLLGGTVFTFGLILAAALLGIGIGGALYARRPMARPVTAAAFAGTCLLEALFIALPYALGDRVAVLAILARPLGLVLGFWGHVAAWTLISTIVIVPAAIVAGYQFPLLIALAGRGRQSLGTQIGQVYAANTAGAIAGSLAGGFGLIAAIGALGSWLCAAILLVLLGVVALALAVRAGESRRRIGALAVPLVAASACLFARGPTAAWRHSAIGAGRADHAMPTTANGLTAWLRDQRRFMRWDADGVESAVEVQAQTGIAFVINGKIDGNVRGDAPTQVMGGLVGAILHPAPRSALVIGLGTGSTAGWLAAVPGMEHVEVYELEPAVLRIAHDCAAVNRDALAEPNLHVTIGDAREALLTSRRRWDVIFSEPSNPYRAGVSSLFTREYYRAVADHLEGDGVFLQWVQGYEVDGDTVRSIYATLAGEFASVTTFELQHADMLLVATKHPIAYDAARLRARIASEPFKSALAVAWRTTSLEGFLARFLAGPALAQAIAATGATVNTDDENVVEFGFARGMATAQPGLEVIRQAARARGEDRPQVTGDVDWARVADEQELVRTSENVPPLARPELDPAAQHRLAAETKYLQRDLAGALAEWKRQDAAPRSITELELVALGLAHVGDDTLPDVLAQLRAFDAVEGDMVDAVRALAGDRNDDAAAVTALVRAFITCRTDPWASKPMFEQAFGAAIALAQKQPAYAARLYRALAEPFAVRTFDEDRQEAALRVAAATQDPATCVHAAHALEPDFPWRGDLLAIRRDCYAAADDPLAEAAAREAAEEALAREGRSPVRNLGSAQ